MEHPGSVVGFLVVVPVLVLLAGASLRWTPPGHLLVLSRRGVVRRVVGEGALWRWPLLDRVRAVPRQSEPLAVSVRARTRDGHEVRVLAESVPAVALPVPGDRADVVERARDAAEAALAAELAHAVEARTCGELDRLTVGGLAVVQLDLVLGPVR